MTNVLKQICEKEISEEEIFYLLDIFIKSGSQIDGSSLGNYVDKHSTGGVGDKTTLVVCPIAAACGTKVLKMSGKALGYTGGTIDKLESIGVITDSFEDTFIKQVKQIGIAISSQTANICPMDKKIYALRDKTNTTKSLSLIAVSIMSKKFACSAPNILIDLKVGNGALIDNIKDAKKLSKILIKMGRKYKKKVIIMITKMDNPLGFNIGNRIEILEVIEMLKNNKQNNFMDLCINMASYLVSMGNQISFSHAKRLVNHSLESGAAYNKFHELIKYQGGNLNIELSEGKPIYSTESGFIRSINAKKIGEYSKELSKGDNISQNDINYNAGIILAKHVGDYIEKGELLLTIYGDCAINEEHLLSSYQFTNEKRKPETLIIKVIK
jgi:pyrimidine-nucleoside phosphorylase